MSISDFLYKIKSQIDIDKITFLYLCIIIGVGISAFGLGRLSVDNNSERSNNIIITENDNLLLRQDKNNSDDYLTPSMQSAERRYVASKNGKMYYSPGCSGAKRIKPENEVWFSTTEEAEKSGYELSVLCK
ncbi:MAG: hypothetical protein WC603_02940 [Candidatus Paceibacterota bacterium]|jgi:hypothetical protein